MKNKLKNSVKNTASFMQMKGFWWPILDLRCSRNLMSHRGFPSCGPAGRTTRILCIVNTTAVKGVSVFNYQLHLCWNPLGI